MNINGFGKKGHVQKFRNHRNEGFEGSHKSKSKKYKFKLGQNDITELLNISLPYIYHKNDTKIATNAKHAGFSGFFL